ncbi:tetratricopeptide repeat protein, partial [bacterium]|nr:tetratricopeptide repeat protein [bacterium]
IVPVALGWLFYSPVRLLGLLAGGLPLALMLGLHNHLLFGSPWFFGELAQHDSIEQIRGGGGVFQTPLSEGLAGILISPGRGLFVYSPVLVLGLIGLVRGSIGPRRFLCLPMLVGMIAVWIVQALHFDWWGGWTFGYRAIVDTVPALCIGLAEIYEQITIIPWRKWVYRTLLGWSVAVQLVGILLYDLIGWNGRELWRVPSPTGQTSLYEPWSDSPPSMNPPIEIVRLNIDQPEYRDRLWSITDSPLVYYVTHPAVSVRNKVRLSAYTAWEVHFRTAETLTSIAKGYQQLGRPGRALSFIRRAVEIDPTPERKALLDLLEGRKT